MHQPINKLIERFRTVLPLSKNDERFIQTQVYPETLKKGTQYCEYGKVCRKLGFVAEGIFKVVRITPQGDSFIPYFITQGHFAVDLTSFTNNTLSEEYIEALTPCTVVTIDQACFEILEHTLPVFSKIIGRLKEKALLEKHRLKSEMLIDSASTRYHKLLQQHPAIIQQVSQQDIAQYLGISPYTLSRIRAKQ